jgi:hypothetical protein
VNKIAQNVYLEIGSGEAIESENLVEFHLLYSGQLHSAGKPSEKHAIRKMLHTQLRHLWSIHPNLSEMALGRGMILQPFTGTGPLKACPEHVEAGLKVMGGNFQRNGFNFLPLVTEDLCLRCSLEILFLRREEKNYILQDGDIDGRIKTLFDALRITDKKDELPPGAAPEGDEDPFFCLLENDSLISEVHVKTGPLLMLPSAALIDKHDVYLQITVRLNTTRPVAHSWVFE